MTDKKKGTPVCRRTPAIIMAATRLLQGKIGRGKIARDRIDDGEFIIKQARASQKSEEFLVAHMEEVGKLTSELKDKPQDLKVSEEIEKSIMRFKGNISMFSNDKCAELAAVMLRWIESVEAIDQDVLDVLDGYQVTLGQIQSKILSDEKVVTVIINEMQAACERYFDKHPELKLQAEITNNNAFYVNEERLKNAKGKEIETALTNEEYDKGLSDEKLIED